MRNESKGENAELRSQSPALAAVNVVPGAWVGQVEGFQEAVLSYRHLQGINKKLSSR